MSKILVAWFLSGRDEGLLPSVNLVCLVAGGHVGRVGAVHRMFDGVTISFSDISALYLKQFRDVFLGLANYY